MMGSGKSSVGKRLAARLDLPFIDVDAWIEDEEGASVATLFSTRGEAAFRELEAKALPSFLEAPSPCVLSVGGGAVTDERSRKLLADAGVVVWLRARPETLHDRLGEGEGRPLLAGQDVGAALTRLATEREPLYGDVAGVVVDVDGVSVDGVVDRIVEAIS